jgi:hypothetical protein
LFVSLEWDYAQIGLAISPAHVFQHPQFSLVVEFIIYGAL